MTAPMHVARLPWMEQAACVGVDPETFFPPGEGQKSIAWVNAAKAVCFSCPVADACLAWAMTIPEFDDDGNGIYGGTMPRDRRNARRRASRKASA